MRGVPINCTEFWTPLADTASSVRLAVALGGCVLCGAPVFYLSYDTRSYLYIVISYVVLGGKLYSCNIYPKENSFKCSTIRLISRF